MPAEGHSLTEKGKNKVWPRKSYPLVNIEGFKEYLIVDGGHPIAVVVVCRTAPPQLH